MSDERIDYFLKGYKKGLKEAWNEILKDGGSGYSVTELRMMIKSKMATIEQRADAQAELLKKELGIEDYGDFERKSEGPEELIEGCSYLIKESSPEASYAILRYMISEEGKPGICVTRKSARVLKEKYGLDKLTLIRLGKKGGSQGMLSSALGITESSISSANLTSLYERIVSYLSQNKGTVLLIDGVEYLISQNEFKSVMRFIQKLNDILEKYGAYMIITISPNSLEPTEMSMLEREMTEVIEI